ncbi:hypothetical protein RP20_CCG017065 [Aedes albopictus]|nr:hypothetical protein RP20_CCG017065 [Aedes albopictus]
MVQHSQFGRLLLVIGILLIPSLEASPWFWPWQSRSAPSIINISIGNRVNTNTSVDEGTSIRDLTFNLSRWKGNLTFEKNGTEIFITRGNDGVTNIHIDFSSNSGNQRSSANRTTPSSNATQPSTSRKKRAIFGLPSFPSIPIPTINGTQAFLGGNSIPLPTAIAIPAINASTLLHPWQFLQTLITRRLPMQLLDTTVSFLAQLYSSTAKSMLDTGVNTLGETMDTLSSVVNSTLDTIEDQVASGIAGVAQSFKQLTRAGQSCVGQVPDDSARPVVTKATGCVRDRWNELDGIVNQFLVAVSDTEDAYGGWLRALDACNARNFAGLSDTTELDAAQRSCYVQTMANSVGKMVDIPMRWASLAARVGTVVSSFQPQVGLCVAGVGAEVASVSANVGVRIVLCQIMQ